MKKLIKSIALVLVLVSSFACTAHAVSAEIVHEYDYLSDDVKTNCVKFVRMFVDFPKPATTFSEKEKSINSSEPRIGSVCVCKSSGSYAKYGHLAYVENVQDGGETITILESNYISGSITRRVGNKLQLKIVGFYDPNA